MQCMYIGNSNIHADTCICVQIHTYTYSRRIFSEYVYFWFIHTYTVYTYIYVQCEKGCFCTGSLKMLFCMYLNVYVRIWFRICMYFVCILYVYCSINAPSNFPYRKYINIRVYSHIHAIYNTYTYNIQHNILQYTYKINQWVYVCICMYIYMHMPVNRFCQLVMQCLVS